MTCDFCRLEWGDKSTPMLVVECYGRRPICFACAKTVTLALLDRVLLRLKG